MRSRAFSAWAAGVMVSMGLTAGRVGAANGTWTLDGSGTWSTAGNWSGSTIADGAGATGNITANINGNRTVTIDGAVASRTLGILTIGDSNTSNSYTLAASGGGTLTLDNGASAAQINQKNTSAGDTISAPLVLNSNLTITNSSSGRTLTLSSGGLTAGSAGTKTITIAGSAAGAVTLSGVLGAGSGELAIIKNNSANALNLTGANTFGGGVTLAAGSLNLNNSGTGGTSSALGTGELTITGGTLGSTAGSAIVLSTNNIQSWNGDFAFGGTQSLNLGTGSVTLSANRQISIGSTSDTLTVGGVIGDGGSGYSLTVANSAANAVTGILALEGANSYSGGTVINGGVVRFGSASAIPATGNITLNAGGALAVAGAHTTLAGWMGESRLLNSATGTLALTGNSSENFDPAASGFNTLALGAVVGSTVNHTGTLTAAAANNTYFVGGGGGAIVFANASAFTGSGKNLTVVGGGTVVLAEGNDYTGATTINGGTLQIGNASTSGSIDSTSGIVNNGVLAFNRSDAVSFDRAISGSGSLIKMNTNTLTLGTAATYGGSTTVNGGTLKSGVAEALPTTTTLTLGNGSSAGNLDLSDFGQTVAALKIVHTASAATSTTTIGSGKTLNVSGNFTVGLGGTTGITTHAVVTGAGSLNVNNTAAIVEVGVANNDQNAATGNTASLNLANLGAFSADVSQLRVGYGSKIGATLTLSNTSNQITAGMIRVSDTIDSNATPASMILGTGTNVLKATDIHLGIAKGNGTLKFASQTPGSPGSVNIAGKTAGSVANFIIGSSVSTTGTSADIQGLLDLRGHEATVAAGTIVLGRKIDSGGTGGAGNAAGTLHFDNGTFAVDSLDMAVKSNSGSGVSTGNLNVGGGSFTVNNSFKMATQSGSGSAVGNVNITGGTLTSNVDIVDGGGNTTTNLTLDGGVLDLTGHNIGSASSIINAFSLRSGTLQNVGEFNGGAALEKTSAGTVTLAGSNTYSGASNVTAGKLIVTGSTAAASAVGVTGATLAGTGIIGGSVSVNAGGHLAPGTLADDLGTGALTFASGSFYDAVLNTLTVQSDRTSVTGGLNLVGSPTLTLADLGGDLRVADGTVFTLISYSGLWDGGTFSGRANNSTFSFGLNEFTIKYDDTSVGANPAVTLTAVPEPGAVGIFALAGLSWLGRRRR